MKRLSVFEKAGGPTASAIIKTNGTSLPEHTGAALRVHMVDIKRVPEICEITRIYYTTHLTNR